MTSTCAKKCNCTRCGTTQDTSCTRCDPFNPRSGTFLYLATGFEDPTVPNALSTVDVRTSKVIDLTFIPGLQGHNTEPHHIGIVSNGTIVGFGGLLSVVYGLPDIFYFDITNQPAPTYNSSAFVPGYSATDEFYPYINGGYLITMMGGTGGGAPGAVAEFDVNRNLIGTWPVGLPEGFPFNPHGISYDVETDVLLTSDFVLPISVVVGPPVFRQTVRMFDKFSVNHAITRTFFSAEAQGGFMSVLFIPGNPLKWAYACAEGQLYLVKPFEPNDALAFTKVLNLPEDLAGYITINRAGTRLFAPTMTNYVYIDITDPEYPLIIDMISIIKYYNGQFCSRSPIGAHYSRLSPDEQYIYVTDYFITSPVITDPGDKKLWRAKITDQQIINDPCFEVDFHNLVFNGTLYHARAHGIAIVADPAAPIPLPAPQCKTFSKLCSVNFNQFCSSLKGLSSAFAYNAIWSIIYSFSLINQTPDNTDIFNTYVNSANTFGLNFAEFYGNQAGADLAQQWFLYLAQGYIVMRFILENMNTDKGYTIWTQRGENLAYFYASQISCLDFNALKTLLASYQKALFDISTAFKQNNIQMALRLACQMLQIAKSLADFLRAAITNERELLCGHYIQNCCVPFNIILYDQVLLTSLLQTANKNMIPGSNIISMEANCNQNKLSCCEQLNVQKLIREFGLQNVGTSTMPSM